MDYNNTITITTGNSIDDATPEEWDHVSKKHMGNK